MVAGAAGRDQIHPGRLPLLAQRNDVLARELVCMKHLAAVSADIAVTRKQLGIAQTRLHLVRVDAWHAACANDAVHLDAGLQASARVVPPAKYGDGGTHGPANIVRSVVQHRFFQGDPGLWQTVGGQLQDSHVQASLHKQRMAAPQTRAGLGAPCICITIYLLSVTNCHHDLFLWAFKL